MTKGGSRPGAGRPKHLPASQTQGPASEPRPLFGTGGDFAMWALNAPDATVPMDQKIRIASALLAAAARQPAGGGDER